MMLYSILILFLLCLTESFLIFHVSVRNSKEYVFSQEINPKSTKLDSFYIKINKYHSCIREDNSTDSFYEVKIINYTNFDFSNWFLTIELSDSAELKNAWNGNVICKDNILTITSDSENNLVFYPKTTTSLELYLNHINPIEIKKITIKGNFISKLSDYPLHTIILVLGSIILVAMIIYSLVYKSMKREIDVLNMVTKRSYDIIEQTMKTFVNFIDAKDEYTRGHSTRVAEYSRAIAKRMGYDEQFQQDIYYMGLMHDIGKITVPDTILNKTTHLTADEWAVIQMHTENGARLLRNFTVIPEIRDAVLYHHERYDGKGYLAQLKGENIPLVARIICVADSYDAMSTNRCYRLKYSKERIIKEFERCSAKQFDPTIASIMIELITDGTI